MPGQSLIPDRRQALRERLRDMSGTAQLAAAIPATDTARIVRELQARAGESGRA